MTIPLTLLLAHFLGDYLLQSDWMATNKAKHANAMLMHVSLYTLCFLPWGLWFAAVTFLTHMTVDLITSRLTAHFWFFQREGGIWEQATYAYPKHGRTLINPWTPIENKRHWFFVVMGADQLIHFATLAWTLELLR